MKTYFATRAEALKRGRELRKLFPKGWKIRVWENLGWHLAFTFTEYVSVYFSPENKKPRFFCLMGTKYGGRPGWTSDYHSSNPMKCVKECLRLAAKDITERVTMYHICKNSLMGTIRR